MNLRAPSTAALTVVLISIIAAVTLTPMLVACKPFLSAPRIETPDGKPPDFGPPAPDESTHLPVDRKAEAEAGFTRDVKWWFGLFTWGGLAVSLALVALSFFFPWASIKAAMVGVGVSVAAMILKYILLAWGIRTIDTLIWAVAIIGGLLLLSWAVPFIVSMVRRNIQKFHVDPLVRMAVISGDETEIKAAAAMASVSMRGAELPKERKRSVESLKAAAVEVAAAREAGAVPDKINTVGVLGIKHAPKVAA